MDSRPDGRDQTDPAEQLFSVLDDLEQQAEALYDAEREVEIADRSRAEYGVVTLASRLMASVDQQLALQVAGVGRVEGTLRRVGTGWLQVRGAGGDWVVPLSAVVGVSGASTRSVPEVAWSPITRLGLASALRRLADAGEPCLVHRVDGSLLGGVVRRVGQDFAEVEIAKDRIELVAFSVVAAIRSGRH